MPEKTQMTVAIVDYGMGNLFSVRSACEEVGMRVIITHRHHDLLEADAIILPGVGAFGDAMKALTRLGLVDVLRGLAGSGKPLIGICLGMQIMMTRSYEFGIHEGLNIIPGEVVRLPEVKNGVQKLKVPHVCWSPIQKPKDVSWEGSYLQGMADGESMYFIHSFYARPADPRHILSVTRFGSHEFCSSLQKGNVFACQFHPERSGRFGLMIYMNILETIRNNAFSTP